MNTVDTTALEEVIFFKVFKAFALRTRAQDGSSIMACAREGAPAAQRKQPRGNRPCRPSPPWSRVCTLIRYGQTGHITAGKEGGPTCEGHVHWFHKAPPTGHVG